MTRDIMECSIVGMNENRPVNLPFAQQSSIGYTTESYQGRKSAGVIEL